MCVLFSAKTVSFALDNNGSMFRQKVIIFPRRRKFVWMTFGAVSVLRRTTLFPRIPEQIRANMLESCGTDLSFACKFNGKCTEIKCEKIKVIRISTILRIKQKRNSAFVTILAILKTKSLNDH